MNDLVGKSDAPRNFFRRAERVLGNHRIPVNVGAIERRHVNGRCHIGGKYSTERRVQRELLDASRCEIDRRTKAPLGFVAIEDLKKLLLITHRARP